MNEKLKCLSIKIPVENHNNLKIVATKNNINLTDFSNQLLIEISKDNTLLNEVAKKTKKPNK